MKKQSHFGGGAGESAITLNSAVGAAKTGDVLSCNELGRSQLITQWVNCAAVEVRGRLRVGQQAKSLPHKELATHLKHYGYFSDHVQLPNLG